MYDAYIRIPFSSTVYREQEPIPAATVNGFKNDTLWVDRYRPIRFTELLGNERVARETLAWVKQWDWCVFGRRPKAKKKLGSGDEDHESLDEFRRPQQKVA
jgi:chromosome transmission fidelity protein 18